MFFRFSGLAAMLGFLALTVGTVLEMALPPNSFATASAITQYYTNPFFTPFAILAIGGALLVMMGLPGIYARQADRTGVLGLIGFVLSFVGWAILEFAFNFANAALFPALIATPKGLQGATSFAPPPALILFFPVLLIGLLLFSIATIRAKVFPRGVGITLLVGVIASILSIPIPTSLVNTLGEVLIYGAIAYGGFALFCASEDSAAVSTSVSRPVTSA